MSEQDKQQKQLDTLKGLMNNASYSRGVGEIKNDLWQDIKSGLVAVPQAGVGLLSLMSGGHAGKFVEDNIWDMQKTGEDIHAQKSATAHAQQRQFDDAKGFGAKLGTIIKNPMMAVDAAIESTPSMLAGGRVGRSIGNATGIKSTALRAGIGEGITMAGSAAENMRSQNDDGLLTGKEAIASLGTGMIGAGLNYGGSKLAGKLGIGDIDTVAAGGLSELRRASQNTAKGGFTSGLKGIGKGAVSEGVFEELPQTLAETALDNWANGRVLSENMVDNAAMGLTAGATMGGVMGGLSSKWTKDKPPQDKLAQDGSDSSTPQLGGNPNPVAPTGGSSMVAMPFNSNGDAVVDEKGTILSSSAEQGTLPQAVYTLANAINEYQGVDEPSVSLAQNLLTHIEQNGIDVQALTDSTDKQETLAQVLKNADPSVFADADSFGQFITQHDYINQFRANNNAQIGSEAVTTPTTPQAQTPTANNYRADEVRRGVDPSFGERLQKPSEKLGLDPNAGVLSKSAVVAVDGGASAIGQAVRAQTQKSTQEPSAYQNQNQDNNQQAQNFIDAPKIIGKQNYIQNQNERLPTQLMVVEADTLTPSTDNTQNQARDRNRTTSRLQVDTIANHLDPAQLTDSTTMTHGSPTITDDGTIIAGNGRTMALKQAYAQGRGEEYRQMLATKADEYGLDKTLLAQMKHPVLVKSVGNIPPDKLRQLALNSNETGTMAQSAFETARADVERVAKVNLDNLHSDDTGNINTPSNKPIINQFVSQFPIEQQNALRQADGTLSKQGLERFENAVLLSAYGDNPTTQAILESTDLELKNAIKALVSTAPSVAKTKQGIQDGITPNDDIAQDITEALSMLAKLRRDNVRPSDYLAQTTLLEDELSDTGKRLLDFMDKNIRSVVKIRQLLYKYYDNLSKENLNQEDMFGKPAQSKQTRLNNALQELGYEEFIQPINSEPTTEHEPTTENQQPTTKGTEQINTQKSVGQSATLNERPQKSQSNGQGVGRDDEGVTNKALPKALQDNNGNPKQIIGNRNAKRLLANHGLIDDFDVVKLQGNRYGFVAKENKPFIEPSQDDINAFVDKVLNSNSKAELTLFAVGQKEIDIAKQSGLDIAGMYHTLKAENLRHAINSHGQDSGRIDGKHKNQRDLTADDLKKIPDVLKNFDELTVQKRKENQSSLLYKKQMADGTIEYVERVIETSRENKPRLVTQTVWALWHTTGVISPRPKQVYTPSTPSTTNVASADNDTTKWQANQIDVKKATNRSQSFNVRGEISGTNNSLPNPNNPVKPPAQTTPKPKNLKEGMKPAKDKRQQMLGERQGLFDLPPIPLTVIHAKQLGFSDTKKLADEILRQLQGKDSLVNDDTGWVLSVVKKDRQKMGDNKGLSHATSQAVQGIDVLVKNAVVAETHRDLKHNNERVKAVHRLYAPALIDGQLHRIKLTVKDYTLNDGTDRKNLHAIEAVEIERPAGDNLPSDGNQGIAQPTTERSISISDLLKGIKHDGDDGVFGEFNVEKPLEGQLFNVRDHSNGLGSTVTNSDKAVKPKNALDGFKDKRDAKAQQKINEAFAEYIKNHDTLAKAAKAYFDDYLKGKVFDTVIGKVHILGSSWQKKLKAGISNQKVDEVKAFAIPFIPEILTNGNYDGLWDSHKERKDAYVGFHSFSKEVSIQDKPTFVRVLVGERENNEFELVVYNLYRNKKSDDNSITLIGEPSDFDESIANSNQENKSKETPNSSGLSEETKALLGDDNSLAKSDNDVNKKGLTPVLVAPDDSQSTAETSETGGSLALDDSITNSDKAVKQDLTQSQQSALNALEKLPDSDPKKAEFMDAIYGVGTTDSEQDKKARRELVGRITTYEMVKRNANKLADELSELGYDVKVADSTLFDNTKEVATQLTAKKSGKTLNVMVNKTLPQGRSNDSVRDGFFVKDGNVSYRIDFNELNIAQRIDNHTDYVSNKEYFGANRPVYRQNAKPTDWQQRMAGQMARLFDDDPALPQFIELANQRNLSTGHKNSLIGSITSYADVQFKKGNALQKDDVIGKNNDEYHQGKMKFSKMGGVVAPISEQAKILQGKPVSVIDEQALDMPLTGGFGAISAWATALFAKQGGKAVNPVLGEVTLNHRSVKDSLAHGKFSPFKNIAFAGVKDVLEKGVLIATDVNEFGEDSFYVSAPITINGRENILTVTVHKDSNSQRMYLHSVMVKEGLLKPRVSATLETTSRTHYGSLTSTDIHNILQKALTYNPTHSHQGGRFGTTFDEIVALLNNRFGKDTIKALQNNGSLKILSLNQAQDEFGSIPTNADGFYVGNTAYLIHDNIHPDMVIATFLHELGGHGGLQTLMSDTAYQNLLKEFDSLVAKGDTTAIKAKTLAHKHTKSNEQAKEEYLPYLITLASRQKDQQSGIKRLMNRMLLAIKSFVRNKLGISLPLTVQDMVGLAEKSVKDRASGQSKQSQDSVRFSQETPDAEIALIRKKYKGTEQWLKAPNGEPTNLTTNQWLQVRTPSFKAWFGDWENDPDNASKVLDGNGEPLVVYHGTKRGNRFYAFENNSQGLHFGTKEQAKARNAGKLIQAFLNIRDIDREDDQGADWNFTIKYAPQRGIDGFVYENEIEGEGDSYIVLKPNQVKSAKENIGTFDPNNDDIRFSLDDSDDGVFARAVDDVFAGHHRTHSKMINLGHTPKAFVQAGLDDMVMLMDNAKLAKIKADHPEMTANLLKQLPRQLNHPVAIFKNTKETAPKNSYVALTELVADNGNSVIVAIHANKTHNGLEFNKIASIYGRNHSRLYIKNMVKSADVRFVDKQKANRVALELQLLDEDTLSLLFDRAIITKDSNQNNKPFDNFDIRFSLDDSDDGVFAKAVDDFMAGIKIPNNITLGTTPDVLKMLGLPNVEVKIKDNRFGKILQGKHTLNPKQLKQIPQQLNNPVAVLKSSPNSTNPDGYVVLTELTEFNRDKKLSEPVIVALHLNKRGDVLDVASAYGKNHKGVQAMLDNDKVLYWHKEKGQHLANVHGLQLPLKLRSDAVLSLANIKTNEDLSQYQDNKMSQDFDLKFSRMADLYENKNSMFAKINIQPKRNATNFVQARQILGGMLNKPLKNKQSGMVATLSRRSLDKMLSGKAVAKSTDSSKHIKAVVNIDGLFENAVLGWVEKDKNNADNVLGVHRLFAPLLIDGKAYLTKLTVKELLGGDGNRIYSVETVDIEKSSVPNMVATAQQSELTTRYHGASVAILAQAIDDYNKESNKTFDNFDFKFSRMADWYAQSQEATQKAVDSLSKVAGEFVANPKSFVSESTKQAVKNGVSDHLGKFLQFLGRRQLTELYGKKLDGLVSYNNRVAQMDADSNENAFKADTLANQWAKVKDSQSLAELMSDVTLFGIDPSVVRQQGINAVRYGQLKARYDKLSDEAKAVFNQARDDYQAHYRAMHQAMSDRIKRNDKLSDERKATLIAKLDKELKQTQKAFFPLTRFGDYVVVVKDSVGNVVNISRAETRRQADDIRQQLIKDNPNHHVGQVALGRELDIAKLKGIKGLASEFLNDDLGLDDDAHKAYLNDLLDREFATSNVMIKNTAGFSQNARRAYAYHMTRGGHYIAKLRHTDQLKADLERMQASVDDNVNNPDFDHIALQRVVDEMNKRHRLLLNPPSSPISTMATAVGFMWYMGLSPASALVNLSQTLLVGLPMMVAKYGLRSSFKMLGDVSALLAKNRNDLTDVLMGDEKKAFDEAVRRGVIDMTMAHDLAGVANGEDSGTMAKIKPVMKVASSMFHGAEKLNRQVTFMASYRLAIQKGLSGDEALEEAIDVTYKSHFDYASSNRPRFMQGNWQRVLFLFKQYGQNMIYTLVYNTYHSFKGETPQERAEARKIMAGILAGHAMTAGVLGLPVAITAPFLAAFSALGGDDDDELTGNETEFRNALSILLGDDLSEVIAKGLPRGAGVDLSGRVGLDSLIFPRLQDGLEGQRWGENMMVGAMGAVAGIPVSMAKGVQQIGQGQTAQGIENMLPKALRDPMKAYRYMTEGNVDKSGIEIVAKDNVGYSDIIQQVAGFRSGKFAQASEVKSAIYQAEQKLNATKKQLKNDYSQAYRDDDKERMNKIWADIQAFNRKYPTQKITKPDLMRSIKARQKRIDNAKDGIYLSKSREHLREYGAFGVE